MEHLLTSPECATAGLLLCNLAAGALAVCLATLIVERWLPRNWLSVRRGLLVWGLGLVIVMPMLVGAAAWLDLGWTPWDTANAEPVMLVKGNVPHDMPAVQAADIAAASPFGWRSLAALVALVWFAGAGWQMVRLGRGVAKARRLYNAAREGAAETTLALAEQVARRLGLRRAPKIFATPLTPTPAVFGVLRPAVVLPESLLADADETLLEAILMHEIAHVRERDPLIGLGQRLATVVFWWCPWVYFLNRRLGDEQEIVCDQWVLRLGGDGRRLAEYLVELAATLVPVPALSLGINGRIQGGLPDRVRRLLDKENQVMVHSTLLSRGVLGLFVAACLGAVLASQVRAQAPLQNPDGGRRIIIIIDGDGKVEQHVERKGEAAKEGEVRARLRAEVEAKRVELERMVMKLHEREEAAAAAKPADRERIEMAIKLLQNGKVDEAKRLLDGVPPKGAASEPRFVIMGAVGKPNEVKPAIPGGAIAGKNVDFEIEIKPFQFGIPGIPAEAIPLIQKFVPAQAGQFVPGGPVQFEWVMPGGKDVVKKVDVLKKIEVVEVPAPAAMTQQELERRLNRLTEELEAIRRAVREGKEGKK